MLHTRFRVNLHSVEWNLQEPLGCDVFTEPNYLTNIHTITATLQLTVNSQKPKMCQKTLHMLEKRHLLSLHLCVHNRENTPSPKTINNYLQNCPKFHDPLPPCSRHKCMTPKTNIQTNIEINCYHFSFTVEYKNGKLHIT